MNKIITPEEFNRAGKDGFPGHLNIVITQGDPNAFRAEMPFSSKLMAPNGFLHGGSVVSLADTATGFATFASLPEGATGFTTIEMKSNHLATARDGTIVCDAKPVHLGRTTQVWDAIVTHRESGKTMALFRCTQMILYPKAEK
jgi:1,4-dihydroxy-2-naphthoyl-CoA hydrolase